MMYFVTLATSTKLLVLINRRAESAAKAMVRELPAMAEAMRFMRQQHHSPSKASVL